SREYLPEPSINLDVNSWFPNFHVSFVIVLSFPFYYSSRFLNKREVYAVLLSLRFCLSQNQFRHQVRLVSRTERHPWRHQTVTLTDFRGFISAEVKMRRDFSRADPIAVPVTCHTAGGNEVFVRKIFQN